MFRYRSSVRHCFRRPQRAIAWGAAVFACVGVVAACSNHAAERADGVAASAAPASGARTAVTPTPARHIPYVSKAVAGSVAPPPAAPWPFEMKACQLVHACDGFLIWWRSELLPEDVLRHAPSFRTACWRQRWGDSAAELIFDEVGHARSTFAGLREDGTLLLFRHPSEAIWRRPDGALAQTPLQPAEGLRTVRLIDTAGVLFEEDRVSAPPEAPSRRWYWIPFQEEHLNEAGRIDVELDSRNTAPSPPEFLHAGRYVLSGTWIFDLTTRERRTLSVAEEVESWVLCDEDVAIYRGRSGWHHAVKVSGAALPLRTAGRPLALWKGLLFASSTSKVDVIDVQTNERRDGYELGIQERDFDIYVGPDQLEVRVGDVWAPVPWPTAPRTWNPTTCEPAYARDGWVVWRWEGVVSAEARMHVPPHRAIFWLQRWGQDEKVVVFDGIRQGRPAVGGVRPDGALLLFDRGNTAIWRHADATVTKLDLFDFEQPMRAVFIDTLGVVAEETRKTPPDSAKPTRTYRWIPWKGDALDFESGFELAPSETSSTDGSREFFRAGRYLLWGEWVYDLDTRQRRKLVEGPKNPRYVLADDKVAIYHSPGRVGTYAVSLAGESLTLSGAWNPIALRDGLFYGERGFKIEAVDLRSNAVQMSVRYPASHRERPVYVATDGIELWSDGRWIHVPWSLQPSDSEERR